MTGQPPAAGDVGGPLRYELPIERGKVYEFARAVKSHDASHRAPVPAIPATFLTTGRNFWEPAGGPLSRLGFDFRRLLHGEEEYVFHGRVPRAGETLAVETEILDRYERAGRRGGTMRVAVIVNRFFDAAGELVAEQFSTLLETGRTPGGGSR